MPETLISSRRLAARAPRHAVLLVTLLSLYIINPFVQEFFSSRLGLILLDLLVSTTLLVVTYDVHRSKSGNRNLTARRGDEVLLRAGSLQTAMS